MTIRTPTATKGARVREHGKRTFAIIITNAIRTNRRYLNVRLALFEKLAPKRHAQQIWLTVKCSVILHKFQDVMTAIEQWKQSIVSERCAFSEKTSQIAYLWSNGTATDSRHPSVLHLILFVYRAYERRRN